MKRRNFLLKVATFLLATPLARLLRFHFPEEAQAAAPASTITRFAFGSCARQHLPQPVWNIIAAKNPQTFIFMGDNVYADTEDMAVMQGYYNQLAAIPEFASFRKKFPIIATWDDHDLGKNDGGGEYPKKVEAKKIMLDFFGEPEGTQRRQQEGVYTSYFMGEHPNRLQVILLDLRTCRTALLERPGSGAKVGWLGYMPNPDPSATMLGATQWAWLENQLRQPADLRIFGSSIQLVSEDHKWEKWGNFPADKKRLFKLIDQLDIRNMFVISGDMHFAEYSVQKTPKGIDVYDLTASAMNFLEPVSVPNRHRVWSQDNLAHFGMVRIDWKHPDVIGVKLEIISDVGKSVFQRVLSFPRKKA